MSYVLGSALDRGHFAQRLRPAAEAHRGQRAQLSAARVQGRRHPDTGHQMEAPAQGKK